jgi:hypothetical protein
VCARKVNARRAVEIGAALTEWQRRGGSLVMVTLTMRHHLGHRLSQELDALLGSWRNVNGSAVWRKWLGRLGSPGLVRVVEVTWGANGWHAHLHFVLLVSAATSAREVSDLSAWLFPKWSREVSRHGMPGALARGQDAHLVDSATASDALGSYLSKPPPDAPMDLGRELTGAASKSARSAFGTSPAWSLLGDFLVTGDADVLDRWHEYERATHGRRQIAWSRGLRDLLAIGQEVDDLDVATEAAGDEPVVFISRAGWATVLGLPEPSSRVLAAMNDHGATGLRAYLDAHGVDYREAA